MKQKLAVVIRVMLAIFVLIALILGARSVLAADVVNQGAGSNSVTPWKTRVVTSTGTAVDTFGSIAGFVTSGAPSFNVAISSTSAAATGLTAGAVYRVACTAPCFFRTGSGTPTAVTTDAPIFGPAVEYLALKTGSTAFAFVTASGTGSCVGTLLTTAP